MVIAFKVIVFVVFVLYALEVEVKIRNSKLGCGYFINIDIIYIYI